MTSNPSGQGFQNKNRVAILTERDKEKRKLLMQNKSSTNHSGANISLVRSSLTKDFQDHTEQQHIAAQILFLCGPPKFSHGPPVGDCYFITQDSDFGNLILPVLPRLEAE
uniref:SOSS complex subunit C n=1 Tax=Naja naja TaxID=35670 RepID=A0A8C6X5V1_NAJNA